MTGHDDSNLPVDARFSFQGGSMMSVVFACFDASIHHCGAPAGPWSFSTYAYAQLMAAPIGSDVSDLEGEDEVRYG